MTTVRFQCDKCGRRLKVDSSHAGRRFKCPKCAHPLVVPEPTHEVPTESASHAQMIPPSMYAAEPDDPLELKRISSEEDGLDMTPMVDVTFLLLIFFMVTAAFSLQKSIEVPPPDATESAAQARTLDELEEDDDFVVIRIDKDNIVWVNDTETTNEYDMLSRLRELRRSPTGSGRPPNNLLVVASGDAWHELVVRALDAGTAVGMEHVRLATSDDDDF